ncbi:peptidase domain-containing ABC transporter [Roseateles chitinivorans]|uniref:peptidase domain-containing ABC transporter n=1 Tax=Roseateles chitinivorans TaxID=2917965 RepID=UPI003D67447F
MTDRLNFRHGQRLPLIVQTEATECGLACLAMVAGFHGHQTDLATLRQRFSISLKGVALKNVMDMASSLNFAARALKLELPQLGRLQAPCILHWDMNHFVVLKQVLRAGKGLVIHDPARGELRLSMEEVSAHFTGVALELRPTSDFEKRQAPPRIGLRQLMGEVTGLKRSLIQIFLLTTVLEILALVAPFFMQWVIDGVILSLDRDLLTLLASGFGLLLLLQTLIGWVRSWAVLYMATHLNLQWVANVFTHLLKLPVSYFEKRHLGDVISRFQSVGTIQKALSNSFVEAFVDGFMALAMLIIMSYYSLWLTAVVMVSIAIYGAARWLAFRPLREATEEQIVMSAREQSLLLESVRGVRAIKLFNHEQERRARWLNAVVDSMNRGVAAQKITLNMQTTQLLVAGLENIAVVWLGARLVMDGAFSVGMLMAFVSYKTTFSQRLTSLIDKLIELSMLRVQGERLADVVLTAPEPEGANNVAAAPQGSALEIRDLWFRYSDAEPWLLQGVNLRFEAGQSVALTGPSGCGKTTLVKLMLGLLQPCRGEITYGGVPLHQLGNRAYREHIGVVMQDDQLLAGSLADNIAFFDQKPDMTRVAGCAHLAAIHHEVMQMPMNYNTLVGDMGTSLSGGQKQRILLARALYKNPKILFLDEATSHLDVERESLVNAAVRDLEITKIMVAHRVETIASAERVIRLVPGGLHLEDVTAPALTMAG